MPVFSRLARIWSFPFTKFCYIPPLSTWQNCKGTLPQGRMVCSVTETKAECLRRNIATLSVEGLALPKGLQKLPSVDKNWGNKCRPGLCRWLALSSVPERPGLCAQHFCEALALSDKLHLLTWVSRIWVFKNFQHWHSQDLTFRTISDISAGPFVCFWLNGHCSVILKTVSSSLNIFYLEIPNLPRIQKTLILHNRSDLNT